MSVRQAMLRWASAIMLVIGVGHLALLLYIAWPTIAGWFEQGLWAAVPLVLDQASTPPSAESLANEAIFWGGPGSFSVPLVLLGCLTWHLAGRGVAIPAAIGWGLAAWSVVGGVLLVPSPFFVLAIPGVLIVLAARQPPAGDGRGVHP